jgi:hypothetical protein
MTTNIVLLAKDRVALTYQALDSLYTNTPTDQFNLTLIDDASMKPVRMSYWRKTNFCILRIERSRGITGQARNLGVYWAEQYWGKGDFLYLSDNDVYFTAGWLEKLTSTLQFLERSDKLKLLGGGTHPFHGANTVWRYGNALPSGGRYDCQVKLHDAVAGYSHLMRWETWDAYGPHDAHAPGTSQSEDFKFCQDIIKAGGMVGSVWPEVVYNTGLTKTDGTPAVGQDVMPRHEGVIQQ